MTTDRIEKSIEMNAPIERVWRALTDHKEFGEWFGLKFPEAFAAGKTLSAWNDYIKRDQIVVIQKIEKPHRFSLTWHPYGVQPEIHGTAAHTLIEFTLETTATGTRLRVVESGFNNIPEHLRPEALRMHTGGWEGQLENIAKYVQQNP